MVLLCLLQCSLVLLFIWLFGLDFLVCTIHDGRCLRLCVRHCVVDGGKRWICGIRNRREIWEVLQKNISIFQGKEYTKLSLTRERGIRTSISEYLVLRAVKECRVPFLGNFTFGKSATVQISPRFWSSNCTATKI